MNCFYNRLRTHAMHLKILSFNAGTTIVFQLIGNHQLLHMIMILCLKSFGTSFISMIILSAQYQKPLIDFAKGVVHLAQ